MKSKGPFYRAVGTMIGAVVGVGVFGLPYAFAQSGFALGLLTLLGLAALLTLLQLMYAEVAIRTPGKDRLVGYLRRYLGAPWVLPGIVTLAGLLWGAMIAYIIVGGRFWHLLLGPLFGGSEALYSLILAGAASALMYRGLKFVSKMEVIVIGSLGFLFTFMVLAALPHLKWSNLAGMDFGNALVPYGVTLFALAGVGIVPELKEVLGREAKRLPHVILVSMIGITALYAAFAFAVVGATGANTTETAFDGLAALLGSGFLAIGALLGSVTILSIYTMVGIELQNTLRHDFRMKRPLAWIITCAVPVALYLGGVREFIGVIGFVGSVFAGVVGVFIVVLYERIRRSRVCADHSCFQVPPAASWLVVGVFAAGIVLEIFHILG